jgi:hypothetical protein
MTTRWRRLAAMILATLLVASGAGAAGELGASDEAAASSQHVPNPRAAITSALLNVFFLPVRLPLTFIGAELAGVTGFLTFGGTHAANDVFGLVDGTQVIDQQVIEGRKPLCVGRYDCEP